MSTMMTPRQPPVFNLPNQLTAARFVLGIILFQAVVIVEQVFFPWAVDTDKQAV